MSPTAAFWIGLVTGDIIASVTIIFVLALLHAGKRGDEIEPPVLPRSARWRGPGLKTAHGAAPNSILGSRPASDQG